MKTRFKPLRPLAALAIASTLAACGGTQSYDLGGLVSGLAYNGLVMANGASTVSVPAMSSGYVFPDKISYGTSFNVSIKTQPDHMTCTITGRSTGSAGTTSTTGVNVSCSINTHSLGGTVTGLIGAGLVLTNGSNQLAIAAGSSAFTFAAPVGDGSSYGVTVLTQPAGQTCTVTNGSGLMGTVDIKNVQVTCR